MRIILAIIALLIAIPAGIALLVFGVLEAISSTLKNIILIGIRAIEKSIDEREEEKSDRDKYVEKLREQQKSRE